MIPRQSTICQAQSFHDVRIEGRDNSLVINQIIQISVEAVKQQTLIRSSPYLGLQRFEGMHHQFFFRRDEFVARLLRSLPQRSLLTVLGPSGSGKSSVVSAGLISQLHERLAKARFRAITFSPDRDPFLSLRSGLNKEARISFGDTEFIRPSPQALLDMVAELRAESDQWLLFINQFEEVFTLCPDERLRTAFLAARTKLARAEQPEVKIVLAMRADFPEAPLTYLYDKARVQLDEIREFPELGEDNGGSCSAGARAGLLGVFSARRGLRRVRYWLLVVRFPAGGSFDQVRERRAYWAGALSIVSHIRKGESDRVGIALDEWVHCDFVPAGRTTPVAESTFRSVVWICLLMSSMWRSAADSSVLNRSSAA